MDCYTNNFPGLPRLKKLAADKHVITELPLVPFVIINLTSLTAGVCMKVRFKSKVTRGFSFSPLRDSHSPLRGSLDLSISRGENSRKTSGTRVSGLLPTQKFILGKSAKITKNKVSQYLMRF